MSNDKLIGHVGEGKIHALASLKNCADELISHSVKEAKQLHEIIEMDRGITITNSHPTYFTKKSPKKPYWKNGKLKYK